MKERTPNGQEHNRRRCRGSGARRRWRRRRCRRALARQQRIPDRGAGDDHGRRREHDERCERRAHDRRDRKGCDEERRRDRLHPELRLVDVRRRQQHRDRGGHGLRLRHEGRHHHQRACRRRRELRHGQVRRRVDVQGLDRRHRHLHRHRGRARGRACFEARAAHARELGQRPGRRRGRRDRQSVRPRRHRHERHRQRARPSDHRPDNETPIDGAIQTDAAINHGNSGGPLLNTRRRSSASRRRSRATAGATRESVSRSPRTSCGRSSASSSRPAAPSMRSWA